MKIINIMLSRKLGGIEQSFLDYSKIIEHSEFDLVTITSKKAEINSKLSSGKNYQLSNFFTIDPLSIFQLIRIINLEKPDYIITHGKRAARLVCYSLKLIRKYTVCSRNLEIDKKVQHIHVAHNYWFDKSIEADAFFTITNHLKLFLISQGIDEDHIYVMPNSIDDKSIKILQAKKPPQKPIIGLIARFIHKKGVDLFIQAINILKTKKVNFSVKIAGGGEEENAIRNLVRKLNLENEIEFCGWVQDKDLFYSSIDMLCVPSRDEPFGIVFLEASVRKVPIVTTKTVGATEIFSPNNEVYFANGFEPENIVIALMELISNWDKSKQYAENCYLKIKANYDINAASIRLKKYLERIGTNVLQ